MPLDCSVQAQDKRREMLRDLIEKRYSGVQSVSDRSRSVTYQDPVMLNRLINALQREIDLCDGNLTRSTVVGRVHFVPFNRWAW
jgi:hypothetical protein